MIRICFTVLIAAMLSATFHASAQKKNKNSGSGQPPFTPVDVRLKGFDQAKALQQNSLVSQVKFRNVGPTIMSGRVVDVDVNPDNSTEFYVAYASGGVWYTNNNGMSFTPVFDHEAMLTVGDIAVDWKRKIIWVGSGENNSSRSSYAGFGMYRSSDGGKTWSYMGLGEGHHFGRIVLDESNPNNVMVAVLGHLYSQNKERGIFKSSDGGNTWRQTLAINDSTGCIDLVRDPNAPEIFYAAAWQRNRRSWNFQESGKGSGIYKSVDGGETWKLVTTPSSGFPVGDGVGRIGLAISFHDDAFKGHVVYALVDNQFRKEKKEEDTSKLTKNQLKEMTAGQFSKLNKKKVENFLSENGFPEKYTADTIFTLMNSGKITPQTLVEYLEDANSLLFDTDVKGAELYRSDDGGQTWHKTHEGSIDDFFYTYGYYFAQVRTVGDKPDEVYIVGFVVAKSVDGGKTFHKISNEENVHVDHHALWIDPHHPGHVVNGNDGGVNITYDDGKNWIKCNNPPVGQFYSVNYDMETPYNVFGGLQDNGVWWGPSTTSNTSEWHQSGVYPYKEVISGDGMQVAVDTRGNSTIYTGYQFGNYFRVNLLTNATKYITPQHDLGERPYRWNWQSPIWISQHNQSILYFGANKIFRALNSGNDFKVISPDLTLGGRKGDVPYGTITTLHESPLKFGLIYAGTDDGKIWVTKDGGEEWKKISESLTSLPANLWVSRVWASKFSEGRVYASLNGYRWDDFNPYLFVSDDYGNSWTRIGNDLPLEPINVVKEDAVNENVIYAGTDAGVYVSLDRGKTFMAMINGLPRVPVHDLCIHPRDHDLILGTHGRSIYIASVKELEQLRDSILQKPLYLFSPDNPTYSNSWGKQGFSWDSIKGPEIEIPLYFSAASKIQVSVYADSSLMLKQFTADGVKGLNYISYDLSMDSTLKSQYETWLNKDVKEGEEKAKLKPGDNKVYYLRPGKYKLRIEANGTTKEETLEVKKPRQ